jgi:hypothetical protein
MLMSAFGGGHQEIEKTSACCSFLPSIVSGYSFALKTAPLLGVGAFAMQFDGRNTGDA